MYNDNEPTLYERHFGAMVDNYLADPSPSYTKGVLLKHQENEKYQKDRDDNMAVILKGDFAQIEDHLVSVYNYCKIDYPPYDIRLKRTASFPTHIYKRLIADLKERGYALEDYMENPSVNKY